VPITPCSYDPSILKITKFTLFSKLPLELRSKIWNESVETDRAIDVVYDEPQNRYFSFNTKVPKLLHASRESRVVALKHYTALFGTSSHPALIYFALETDVLVLDDWLAGGLQRDNRNIHSCQHELSALLGPLSGQGSSGTLAGFDVNIAECRVQNSEHCNTTSLLRDLQRDTDNSWHRCSVQSIYDPEAPLFHLGIPFTIRKRKSQA